MTTYIAIVTEKTAATFGKTFANTKNGPYKGMSKEEFTAAIRYNQAFTFEVREM